MSSFSNHARANNSFRQAGRLPGVCGAVLLEVVVALGLLVGGLAMVGLQMRMGIDAARASEMGTRAVLLVDTKFAELYAGVIKPESDDDELKGDFGLIYPGFLWFMKFEETETENLLMITLYIGYDKEIAEQQISNPETEVNFEEEDMHIVRTTYRLWPKPPDINMERDYGIDMDELTEMALGQSDEGGSESESGGNPIMDAILSMLAEHPDIIKDDGSIDVRALADLPADQFKDLVALLQTFTGGGNMNNIQQMLESQGRGDALKNAAENIEGLQGSEQERSERRGREGNTEESRQRRPGRRR
jgi:hypothetical protein